MSKPLMPAPKPTRPPRKPKGLAPSKKRLGRNEDRSRQQFEWAFHSEDYVEFVKSLACAVPGCRRENIQCAHVGATRANGGRWFEIVPLCGPSIGWAGHHAAQEGRTEQFNEEHGIDLLDIAALTALRFKESRKPDER